MFGNRIEFIADAYLKQTENLLMNMELPTYAGTAGGDYTGAIEPPVVNIGAIENKGFEFTLNTVNIDRGGFRWTTGLVFSLNRNEVKKMTSDSTVINKLVDGTILTRTRTGDPVGLFYGYIIDGMFNTADDFYMKDETGNYIQERGAEFGATTGRRRRCGWLDLVMIRDSVRLNGLTSLSITKLDVLSGLEKLKICVGYELQGKRIDATPAGLKRLAQCIPIYEELPGWDDDISSARRIDDLPAEARDYLNRIVDITGIPLSVIGVGSGREETILLKDPFQEVA